MIALDATHLMMIEPKHHVSNLPTVDDYTYMALYLRDCAIEGCRYKGFHICTCGTHSDNADWILPTGHITNSLLVHYVEWHRVEIPEQELDKLKAIYETIKRTDV